ncbi:MAG: hypothetical protein ACR2HJ_04360 [Fimbriimonadales bacterium]
MAADRTVAANTNAALEHRVELWDWTPSAWESVSTTTPSGTDTTVAADPTGWDDKRFVSTDELEAVNALVRWYGVGGTASPWKVEIKQATWTSTRN